MTMTSRRQTVILILALALAIVGSADAPAQAPARQLFGQRDFEMDWQLEPAGTRLRVRFLAASRRLRIETLDASEQVMIRDLATGAVAVLVAEGKKGAFGSKSPPMAAFQPEVIGETREVAGNPCRQFEMQGQRLCVTDDGIPVAVVFANGTLQATSLVRQTQNAALFEVPKSLVLKPLPGAGAGSLPKIPF